MVSVEKIKKMKFGEATVADLQDQVEDKEDFIKQLEQEIEDIEKKLAE